jgi:hypothetical protein
MDVAYYEDLAGRLYGLVIRFSDRLPAGQVQWLHHVTEVGEYGLALEDMTGMLTHGQVAITNQEGDDILTPCPPDEDGQPRFGRAQNLPARRLTTASARIASATSLAEAQPLWRFLAAQRRSMSLPNFRNRSPRACVPRCHVQDPSTNRCLLPQLAAPFLVQSARHSRPPGSNGGVSTVEVLKVPNVRGYAT